jgi:N-acetylglucosaminyl-diphospho-decaprenol L-rhamnosyltransferase
MPGELDIAVIIVTYNSADVIEGLLDSIPAALGSLTADVVVVDNGSADHTVELLGKHGGCRVVQSANVGYAGGINRGVREAGRAEAILILNPDARLTPGSVPPMLETLRTPGTGLVVPQLRSPAGTLEPSLRRTPTVLRALGLSATGVAALSEHVHTSDTDSYLRPHPVDWATGAVVLMSRACFDLLGGWDESFFLYSEETDVCLRARDEGLVTRYEPRAVAVHIGGGSGRTEVTHAMQAVNRVRLYRRRNRAPGSWLYYAVIIAGELSHAARGQRQSRFAVAALLRPSLRPAQLGCSDRLLPR